MDLTEYDRTPLRDINSIQLYLNIVYIPIKNSGV